jgi:hypothetical protein
MNAFWACIGSRAHCCVDVEKRHLSERTKPLLEACRDLLAPTTLRVVFVMCFYILVYVSVYRTNHIITQYDVAQCKRKADSNQKSLRYTKWCCSHEACEDKFDKKGDQMQMLMSTSIRFVFRFHLLWDLFQRSKSGLHTPNIAPRWYSTPPRFDCSINLPRPSQCHVISLAQTLLCTESGQQDKKQRVKRTWASSSSSYMHNTNAIVYADNKHQTYTYRTHMRTHIHVHKRTYIHIPTYILHQPIHVVLPYYLEPVHMHQTRLDSGGMISIFYQWAV